VLRYTYRGSHQGQWRGVPPTGKSVTVTGTTTCRIAKGKIAEIWHNADALGLVQQLGLVPTLAVVCG
jgi:predicted ester cyclase